MKKKKIYCVECDLECEVRHESKTPIGFCPFCSEEVTETSRKLYQSFDELDSFESDSDTDDEEIEDSDESTEDE